MRPHILKANPHFLINMNTRKRGIHVGQLKDLVLRAKILMLFDQDEGVLRGFSCDKVALISIGSGVVC